MKLYVCLLLSICSGIITANAQYVADGHNFIPETEAWSFMKYGQHNVNHYTGTATTAIPIYTYKDTDFEVPVSLVYASNGYMPNITASNVGLGWHLNAGGYITREVKGLEDEYEKTSGGKTTNGFYFMHVNDITMPDIENEKIMDIGMKTDDNDYYLTLENSYRYRNHIVDSSPDIFSFNFFGHAGKFHMGNNGQVYVYETHNPQGEYKVDLSEFKGDSSSLIKIHTGDGYIYTFKSFTWSKEGEYKTFGKDKTIPALTWSLIEVLAPNQRRIELEYFDPAQYPQSSVCERAQPNGYGVSQYSAGKMLMPFPGGVAIVPYANKFDEDDTETTIIKMYVAPLHRIRIDNFEIEFLYDGSRPNECKGNSGGGFNQLKTPNRLCAIEVNGIGESRNNTFNKRCDLEHTYSQGNNPVMFLSRVTINGEGIYEMSYYDHLNMPAQGTVGVDHWGFFNNKYQYDHAAILPEYTDEDYNKPMVFDFPFRDPSYSGAVKGILKKISYPTGGYSEFQYESHTVSSRVSKYTKKSAAILEYLWENEDNIEEVTRAPDWREKIERQLGMTPDDYIYYLEDIASVSIGGLRIKKITNCALDNGVPESTAYEYVNQNFSSGVLLEYPTYLVNMSNIFIRYPLTIQFTNSHCTTSSAMPAYSLNKPYIEYSSVKEKYSDNSSSVYEYETYKNIVDFALRILGDYDIFQGNLSDPKNTVDRISRQFQRGKLLSKKQFNQSGRAVSEYIYTYDYDKELQYSYSIRKCLNAFYKHKTYIEGYPLVTVRNILYFDNNTSEVVTNYEYNSYGQVSKTEKVYNDGVIHSSYIDYFHTPSALPGSRNNTSYEDQMVGSNVLSNPKRILVTVKSMNDDEKIVDVTGYRYGRIETNISNKFQYKLTRIEKKDFDILPLQDGIPMATEAVFNHYNKKGNLLQQTDRNDVKTSFIWGYGGKYLVGLVKNASLSQICDISGLQSLTSNPLTESLTSSNISALHGITDAAVSVYEYRPYVGVSTVTDPSGRKTYYEYSSSGKLISIKDNSGNTIKEYSYSSDNSNY